MDTRAAVGYPAPALAWDRIEDNERRTRGLLTAFACLLVPFALALMPLATFGVRFLAAFVVGEIDTGTWMRLGAVAFLAMLAVAALVGYSQYSTAGRSILRGAGARPVGDGEPELRRAVENLCIGAGLPVPAVHVIETAAPNALTAGLDPARAEVAVTRGLLQLLNRRELRAVIAHELSHIGNADVRLGSTLAASMKVMRLPMTVFEKIAEVYSSLIGEHEPGVARLFQRLEIYIGIGISVAGLAVAAIMFVELATTVGRAALDRGLASAAGTRLAADASTEIFLLTAAAAPAFLLWAGRILGWTIDRSVLRTRELLADADAFVLTGDAEALACALVKIDAVGLITPGSDGTNAHLFVADPTHGAARWWNAPAMAHPPVAERVAQLRSLAAFPSEALERARSAALQWAESHPEAHGDGSALRDALPGASRDWNPLDVVKLIGVALLLLVPLLAAIDASDLTLRREARGVVFMLWAFAIVEYVRRRS